MGFIVHHMVIEAEPPKIWVVVELYLQNSGRASNPPVFIPTGSSQFFWMPTLLQVHEKGNGLRIGPIVQEASKSIKSYFTKPLVLASPRKGKPLYSTLPLLTILLEHYLPRKR